MVIGCRHRTRKAWRHLNRFYGGAVAPDRRASSLSCREAVGICAARGHSVARDFPAEARGGRPLLGRFPLPGGWGVLGCWGSRLLTATLTARRPCLFA